jgi:hypothetical protein
MTRLKLMCAVAVVLGAAVGARYLFWSGVGDHHTVDWYLAHEGERRRVLQTCDNDHALDDDPDCKNADAGERAATVKAAQEKMQRDLSKLEGEPEPKSDH